MAKTLAFADSTPQWPTGTGELATLIRQFDWSKTPLGAIASWPQSLRTSVDVALQSPVPIVMLFGPEGIMIYNDSYAEFAGERHPQLLGAHVLEGWHEVADFNRHVLQTGFAGETLTFQDRHLVLNRHGTPEDVWCDLYYSPLLNEQNTPFGVMAIVVETTARIRSEQQRQTIQNTLNESEERYKTALSASELVGTWDWDLYNDIVICDERFARLFQIEPEQASIGVSIENFLQAVHPDDITHVQHEIERAITQKDEFKAEYRVCQADGSTRWLNARGSCHYNNEGRPTRFPGVVIDITERKQIEHIIAGQRQALEQSMNNEPLANILNTIIHTVENQSSNKLSSSIFLLDDDGYHLRYGAAPSLSQKYIEAIDGIAIDDESSSCGAAAFRREEVFVDDVMTDRIWSGLRDLAKEQGFRSCWSMPLISSKGKLLGTFALYYPDVRHPSAEDRSIVQLVSHTAILVLERHADNLQRLANEKYQAALIELGDRLRELKDVQDITNKAMEIVGKTLNVARTGYGMVDETQEYVTIDNDWTNGTVDSIVGTHRFIHYGAELANKLKRGDILVISDTLNDPVMAGGAERLKAVQVASLINVPLIEDGKLVAIFYIHDAKPRIWTPDEINFVRNVGDRTWAAVEQALVEKELRESEQHFRQMANSMPQMIWVTRPDGFHEYYNKRWYEFTGAPDGSTDGSGWNGMFHPDDRKRARERWEFSLRTGEPYEIEYRLRRHDGVYCWTLGRALPIRDKKGRIQKWYGTCTDISETKEISERLEAALIETEIARDQAQQANIAKSEFLANMSHEIRTPMNAVIGLSNILANSQPLTPRQKEFIHTLQLSADALLSLINDLLDISKIEARTIDLERIPFSICQIVREIADIMDVKVKEKGLSFTINSNQCSSYTFLGDPARLRQVILNLCSNAVKFTEKGGITISISDQTTEDPAVRQVAIAVTDTGIGIPADKQLTIFEKFVQADSSINRKYGGTGLGLAITKTLTEIMGGTITLESETGKGSTFTVHIPLETTDQPIDNASSDDLNHVAAVDTKPLILLVEDYAPNILVAGNYLEQFGYTYHVANSGQEAVQSVKDKRYAAILMDVQMHGMNGLEATRHIRQYEQDHNLPSTPIIGMTAHALAGDRELCIEAGMDDYISKPFNPTQLESILRNAVDVA